MYAQCDIPFITYRIAWYRLFVGRVKHDSRSRVDDEDDVNENDVHTDGFLLRLAASMTRISDLRISNDTSVTTVSRGILFHLLLFLAFRHSLARYLCFTNRMNQSIWYHFWHIYLRLKLNESKRIYDNFKKF